MSRALHETSKHFRLQTASSSINANYEYKPGGTATYIRDHLCSRFHSKGCDPMGRWSFIKLHKRGGTKVVLLTLYQPCKGKPKHDGSMTVITQQYSILWAQAKTKPENVRKHFMTDLSKFLSLCRRNREELIIGGDFNEVFGASSTGIAALCRKHVLTDAINHTHGAPPEPFSTWIDGKDILDYILVSSSLLPAISRCGYEKFLAHIHGDHRGMYIDFDTTKLFGAPDSQLAPMAVRRLKSTNPQHVTKYFQTLHTYLEGHNYFNLLQRLQQFPSHKLAERLDKTRIQGCIYAESRLPQYPDTPYSPAIVTLRNTLGLLRMFLYQHNHGIDLHEQIQASIEKQYDDFLIPVTLVECKARYDAALKKLKAAEKDEKHSGEKRQAHLQQRAEHYSDHGDLTAEQYLKRLKQCEDTARVFQRCKQARGLNKKGGFSTIDVPLDPAIPPKESKQWRTVDCPKEIEAFLLQRNQQHFGQAMGTPLTVYPMEQEIDFGASTATTDLILEGRFTHEDLDDTTQLLIDHLKQVSPPAVKSYLTYDELIGKNKAWREKTSTSPSGVHLGHLKAYIAPHTHKPGTPECDEFEASRTAIIDAHLQLINYAIEHHYSYERWRTIVMMMIEKEAGNTQLHRLRIIHIYEADYNLLLCVKWRQVLHHAARSKTLSDSQCGSRPGRSAPEVVFVEEIEYEIVRATRTPLGKFDNDATACYDRLLCWLANTASQKYGQARDICILQGMTLEQAKYYIRTTLGVSDGFIQHSQDTPIHGTGQGSGNSSQYWALVSSTLFDCHSIKAHGAMYASPDNQTAITLYMLGFVDDTSNRTNYFERHAQPSQQELLQLMQHDAQIWSNLLWSSGGALELPKCSYHHVRFQFDFKGRPSMIKGHFGPPLFIQDHNNNNIHIQQLGNDEAHKLLGCYKSPNGDLSKQSQMLTTKCNDFAKVVNSSFLSKHDSMIFYRHIYIPSVTYPLSSTSFTAKQMDAIQTKANRRLAQSCGYSQATPFPIIYGPALYGGASLHNLMDSQSIQQIQQFVKHWRTSSTPGTMLRICMSWWQFIAGTSEPLLTNTSQHLPHFDCESKYISSLRRALNSMGATIELDQSYIPPLQRHQDDYFMDLIMQSGKFSTTEILYINLCRLNLQILTVADIANAAGTHLDMSIKAGTPSALSSSSRLLYCHQEKPKCPHVWDTWRRACFVIAYKTGKLRKPLGHWLFPPKDLRRSWAAYYDPPSNTLYIPNGLSFCQHHRYYTGFLLSPASTINQLPPQSIPVDINYTDHLITINWSYQPLHAPMPSLVPALWDDYLAQLPAWERPLYFGLQIPNIPLLTDALSSGQVIIATDGSAPGRASFGWIIAHKSGAKLAQCYGPAYGYRPSSYHAEGYGIVSPLRLLYHLSKHFSLITRESPSLVCDNKGFIDNINSALGYDDFYANASLSSDWDLLNEVIQTAKLLTHPPSFTHIKGHQDSKTPYDRLSLPAQLNVDADMLADQYIEHHTGKHLTVPLLPHARCQVHMPQGTITHQLKREIVQALRGPPLLQLISTKHNWTAELANSIDWTLHGHAMRSTTHPTTMVKYVHGLLPVGWLVNKYDKKYSSTCPSCHAAVETTHHLHHCPSVARALWRKTTQQAFRKVTDDRFTHPDLQTVLLLGLASTLDDLPDPDPTSCPELYRAAVAQQNLIGWDQFLRGRWSALWQPLHHKTHTTPTSSKLKPTQWAPKLLNTLWTKWFEMWTDRNQDRHGHDALTKAKAQREQAQREIQQLYDWEPFSDANTHSLFTTPLATLLDKPTYQLIHWINLWKEQILASIH